jgi:hypothetical protein
MKTTGKKKLKKPEVVQTVQPTLPPKPDWGNPFHNQQRFSNKIIGGKRGFSGASRKGMGGGK